MATRLSTPSRSNAGLARDPSIGLLGWALTIASRVFNWWRLRDRPDHRRRVLRSHAVLRTLTIIFAAEGGAARVFGYLRKIDPLVFEEVILSAAEQAGAFVLRNRRYTGDGGLDGRIWIPGTGLVAVQSKRYCSHVARSHIAALGRIVEQGGFTAGMFVHCGRTSQQTLRQLANSSDGIVLLSGRKLLDLLLNGQFVVAGSPGCGYRPGSANYRTRPGLNVSIAAAREVTCERIVRGSNDRTPIVRDPEHRVRSCPSQLSGRFPLTSEALRVSSDEHE